MAITPSVLSAVPSVGMPGDPTPVLLLRHGQSEWNAVRRWQGSADTPLTELGREQARRTAHRLQTLDADFVGPWSSDLARASETASILADGLGIGPVVTDPRLREAHAGEWQGMTPDEIEAAYPGWLAAHRRPSSFEPFAEVVTRAVDAVVAITSTSNGAGIPLVVTHSGLIRSMIRDLGVSDTRIPNLGGVWLKVGAAAGAASSTGAPHDRAGGNAGRRGSGPDGLDLVVGDLFDPSGIPVSGVDAPGEDPGDQPDQPDAHRSTQG